MRSILNAAELEALQAEVSEAMRRGLPVPPDLELYILKQEMLRRGRMTFDSFRDFVDMINPSLTRFEHIPLLVHEANKVVTGETNSLLVLMPTRYMKSEVMSRLLPAYYLLKHPRHEVALSSYGADLAWELSEQARENYHTAGGRFKNDQSGKKRWFTTAHGGLWAAGTGGPLLGRGFNLGVVDDPVKAEEAFSEKWQRTFQRWWVGTFLGRRQPPVSRARLVFIMQRLGPDDPVDFLLRREVGEQTDLAPLHWRVLVMDELKSDEPLGRWKGPRGLPPTCTLVDDKRMLGEALSPSLMSEPEVRRNQRELGPYVTASQRQQRPLSPSGGFWHRDWFDTYDTLPTNAYDGGKDWDTAYSEKEANSASAFVESYRGPGKDGSFFIYIQNVNWKWLKFPELVAWIRSLNGPHYVEAKASGKSLAQTLKPHGVSVEEVAVFGSKFERATAAQPAASNHRVLVRRAIAERLLYGERQGLLRISAEQLMEEGAGLDLNDAFTQAIARHLGLGLLKAAPVVKLWGQNHTGVR